MTPAHTAAAGSVGNSADSPMASTAAAVVPADTSSGGELRAAAASSNAEPAELSVTHPTAGQ